METSASFEARSAPLPYPTTGMMSRMKESHRKGVVTHPDPKSCTASREAGGEA